jgi:hypothetical protein
MSGHARSHQLQQQVGHIRTAFVVELARVGCSRGKHHNVFTSTGGTPVQADTTPSLTFEAAVLQLLYLSHKGRASKHAIVFDGRLVPPVVSYIKRCFQAQALTTQNKSSLSISSFCMYAEACSYALVGLCTDPKCAAQLVKEGLLSLVAHMCSFLESTTHARSTLGDKGLTAHMPQLPVITQLDLLCLRNQWDFHCSRLARALGTNGDATSGSDPARSAHNNNIDFAAPKADFVGLEWEIGCPESTHFAGLFGIICLILSILIDSPEWSQIVTDGSCLNILMLHCYDIQRMYGTPSPVSLIKGASSPSWTRTTERLLVMACLDKFRDKDLERFQRQQAEAEKMHSATTDLPKYIVIGDIEGINAALKALLAEEGKGRNRIGVNIVHMCEHITSDLTARNEFLKKLDFLGNGSRGKDRGHFPTISIEKQVEWLKRQMRAQLEVVEDVIQSVDVSGRNAVSVQSLRHALSILQLHLTAKEATELFEVLHQCSPKSSRGYSSFFLLKNWVSAVENAVIKFSHGGSNNGRGGGAEDGGVHDPNIVQPDVIHARHQLWQAEYCRRGWLEADNDVSTFSCLLRYLCRNRLRMLKAFASKDVGFSGSIPPMEFCKCLLEQHTHFGTEDIRKMSHALTNDTREPIYYLELMHLLCAPPPPAKATRNHESCSKGPVFPCEGRQIAPFLRGTETWKKKLKCFLSIEIQGGV